MAINPISYIRESKAELARVIWPTRIQTLKLTITVAIGAIAIGAYIAGLDAILTKLTERFLR